jgi:dihydrofolate reductase
MTAPRERDETPVHRPKVVFVVAAGRNGVIGRDNAMPWRMPSSLKRFRQLTLGKPMIMGRKTFQSIGRALDGRDTIVVTRDLSFSHPDVVVVHSPAAALEEGRRLASHRGAHEIIIAGGADLYAQMLPLADRVYLDVIDAAPEGEAIFPALPPADWKIVSRHPIEPATRDDHAAEAIVYERVARAQVARLD